MSKYGKYADLAIVNLALLTAILAHYSDRFATFFWKTSFVYKQAAIGLPADLLIGVTTKLINDGIFLPGGLRKKMLIRLIIGVGNRFCHTFHVLFLGLEQSFEVLFGAKAYITSF